MTIQILVPVLGESIAEATVSKWLKSVGDAVARDEPVVELETDKVTLEVPAASAGTLAEIVAGEGDSVEVGAVLGTIGEGAPAAGPPAEAPGAADADGGDRLSPAVRRLVEEKGLDPAAIPATGRDGRLTKGDVLAHLEDREAAAEPPPPAAAPSPRSEEAREERVPMTRLRRRIAERLKEAQNTAAMLTTFNEIDMTSVMAAREKYRGEFEKRHGCRLGFMSFFVKACVVALREIPAVNAEIDGDELVYKNHYDIGVAVGTEQGLVVPVLRDADRLGFAEIEKGIADFGARARDGKLAMDDLTGGTFTVTNGGIYGSMMSTPILNPPQSGILGMHRIDRRPVAVGDAVEIRPMMYVALSYDHRIVDGREAVTFLVRVKQCVEDPERMLLAV